MAACRTKGSIPLAALWFALSQPLENFTKLLLIRSRWREVTWPSYLQLKMHKWLAQHHWCLLRDIKSSACYLFWMSSLTSQSPSQHYDTRHYVWGWWLWNWATAVDVHEIAYKLCTISDRRVGANMKLVLHTLCSTWIYSSLSHLCTALRAKERKILLYWNSFSLGGQLFQNFDIRQVCWSRKI